VAVCGVLAITTISVAFVTRHMPPARG
jgi:hypothetical protein